MTTNSRIAPSVLDAAFREGVMTIGPFWEPLTPDEERSCSEWAKLATGHRFHVYWLRDVELRCVCVVATDGPLVSLTDR